MKITKKKFKNSQTKSWFHFVREKGRSMHINKTSVFFFLFFSWEGLLLPCKLDEEKVGWKLKRWQRYIFAFVACDETFWLWFLQI